MISLTSIAVAADLIGRGLGRPLLRDEDRRLLFPAIAVVGLALYLALFSVLPLDLYRAGFSAFAPLVLAAAAIAVAHRAPRLACLAAAVLALVAVAAMLAIYPFGEWAIHVYLLHMKPVKVGDQVCCYAEVRRVGRTSLVLDVETWVLRNVKNARIKVTRAEFTYVAVDAGGRPSRAEPLPEPHRLDASVRRR